AQYAEFYKELGLAEFGYLFRCNRDFAMVEGFNPTPPIAPLAPDSIVSQVSVGGSEMIAIGTVSYGGGGRQCKPCSKRAALCRSCSYRCLIRARACRASSSSRAP